MIHTLRFHPAAVEEMAAAIDWYDAKSSRAADRFALELIKTFETIQKAPYLFAASDPRTRRAIVQHFPFAIVYLVTDEQLLIIAVSHMRRRPGYWRDRIAP